VQPLIEGFDVGYQNRKHHYRGNNPEPVVIFLFRGIGKDNGIEYRKAGEHDQGKEQSYPHAGQGGNHKEILEFLTQFFSWFIHL
jgi:hypothetical protein